MENLNNLKPFFIGQKIICINRLGWINNEIDCIPVMGPKFNEVCTVIGYSHINNYPILKEYRTDLSGYRADCFKPLQEQKFPLISYSKVLEEVEVGSN